MQADGWIGDVSPDQVRSPSRSHAKTNQHSREHMTSSDQVSRSTMVSKLAIVPLHLHAVVDTYDCIRSYTISVSWMV